MIVNLYQPTQSYLQNLTYAAYVEKALKALNQETTFQEPTRISVLKQNNKH